MEVPMSTTEAGRTGNLATRTLIAALAVADLAALAMIGRAIQRVITEDSIAWKYPWVAGASLAVAAFALLAAVWLGGRAWSAVSPQRRRLLMAYSAVSIALWVAAMWLLLLLEDLSY